MNTFALEMLYKQLTIIFFVVIFSIPGFGQGGTGKEDTPGAGGTNKPNVGQGTVAANLTNSGVKKTPKGKTDKQRTKIAFVKKDLSLASKKKTETRTKREFQVVGGKTKVVEKKVLVEVSPTILVIDTAQGATVLLEPLDRSDEPQEVDLPESEGVYIFEDVKPGKYNVAATRDGYTDVEATIEVRKEEIHKVTLDIKPILYKVSIKTNILSGEVRFEKRPNSVCTPEDSEKIISVEKGQIQKINNSEINLANLEGGTYFINIKADELGYQLGTGCFTVPGTSEVSLPLKRNLSKTPFAASWSGLSQWEVEGKWAIESGKVRPETSGKLLPKDNNFRYYTDFNVVSNVRMVNDKSVSFILRAKDAKNYYLVQITGKKSDEPYILRGFVVKEGQPFQFGDKPALIGFAQALNSEKFFVVNIEVVKNRIKVDLEDTETGDNLTLGILEDPDNTYLIGANGFSAGTDEKFEVERYIVSPK